MEAKEWAIVDLEDRIYTAGLFDGEGSLSLAIHKGMKSTSGLPRNSPTPLLQLSSCDANIIHWLLNTWGVGHTITNSRPKRPHHRTSYGWRVYSAKAIWVIRCIYPYLKIKKPQADLFLEYASFERRPSKKLGSTEMQRRLEYRERMMALNGRRKLATIG